MREAHHDTTITELLLLMLPVLLLIPLLLLLQGIAWRNAV
jgi:hypothetical protein